MNETKAKQQAKERDGWVCQFCEMDNEEHKEEYGRGLHAHHIIKQATGGADRPRNLITVCRDCHSTLEHTQSRGLEQIKEGYAVKEVEHQRDALLERVELLERAIRTPEFYAEIVGGVSAHGEAVTEQVGDKVSVTSDPESAEKAYQDWGSKKERVSLRADKTTLSGAAENRTQDSERLENLIRHSMGQR